MLDCAMSDANDLYKHALISGAAASLLSVIALAISGQAENRRPAGPINGPSQWIHGRSAAKIRTPSVRHTLTGFLIHHATATGWAMLHERVLGKDKAQQTFAQRLGRAAVTATVANVVDFQLTPKRLRPGFETQLSRTSLFAVYAAFAVGLALVAPRKHTATSPTPEPSERHLRPTPPGGSRSARE
jgi:hypothetical protein